MILPKQQPKDDCYFLLDSNKNNNDVKNFSFSLTKYTEEKTPELFITKKELIEKFRDVKECSSFSRASTDIAKDSRRGMGNVIFYRSVFNPEGFEIIGYFGTSEMDQGVVETSDGEKYLISPNFEKYFRKVKNNKVI